MDDLALALHLADLADEITLRHFRSERLETWTKPDLTPVTEADRAVEQVLREHLAKERPDDGVLGEEFGAQGGAEARWIIDPIDGTKNYLRGVPVYATLVALERGGEQTVGVCSAPAMGRRWWASRGGGAFADGRRLRVSRVAELGDAFLCYGSLSGWEERGRGERFLDLLRRCWRTRGFGDFWIHLLVAEGAADLAVEPEVSLWDLAAVKVIVEEAGGRFTDLAGVARADGGSAVCSNGLLHDRVLDALGP
ncbi:MAG TPA: histidinol-phosphatase [Actinomycetota bacterium]|jgi:histidinol-phosphatase